MYKNKIYNIVNNFFTVLDKKLKYKFDSFKII